MFGNEGLQCNAKSLAGNKFRNRSRIYIMAELAYVSRNRFFVNHRESLTNPFNSSPFIGLFRQSDNFIFL